MSPKNNLATPTRLIRALAIAAGAIAVMVPIVLIGTASASTDAYRDAPPPGFSSGFGEPSCHACHFSREPNEAPGRLGLRGVPDRYSPGATYAITVTLTRAGMAVAGFQLTARFTDGAQTGRLARAGAIRQFTRCHHDQPRHRVRVSAARRKCAGRA